MGNDYEVGFFRLDKCYAVVETILDEKRLLILIGDVSEMTQTIATKLLPCGFLHPLPQLWLQYQDAPSFAASSQVGTWVVISDH